MIPRRPYLLRAFYDWLTDNQLTPYLMVDVSSEDVIVPREYVQDGKLILNIDPSVVSDLVLANKEVRFDAYFSAVPFSVVIPIASVLAIYAQENGLGTLFEPETFESKSEEVKKSDRFLNLVETPKEGEGEGEANKKQTLEINPEKAPSKNKKKSKSQPPALRVIK